MSSHDDPVALTDVVVEDTEGAGVALSCSDGGYPQNEAPCSVDVDGLQVTRAGLTGLAVGQAGSLRVRRAIVRDSSRAPEPGPAVVVAARASYGPAGAIGDVTGGGNGIDAIGISGVVDGDLVWSTPRQTASVHPLGHVNLGLTVGSGASLTVPSGSAFATDTDCPQSGGAPVGCRSRGLHVDGGRLVVQAGALLTSASDPASTLPCPSRISSRCTPAAGDWEGVIAYGGSVTATSAFLAHANGAVVGTYSDVDLQDTDLRDLSSTGVAAIGGSLRLTGGTVGPVTAARSLYVSPRFGAAGTGVSTEQTRLQVTGTRFTRILGTALSAQDSPEGARVVDAVVEDAGGDGVVLRGRAAQVLQRATVRRVRGSAALVDGAFRVGPGGDVDGNTGSGNGLDAVELSGDVVGDVDWVTPTNSADDHALGLLVGRGDTYDRSTGRILGQGLLVLGGTLRVPAAGVVRVRAGREAALTVQGGALEAGQGALLTTDGDPAACPYRTTSACRSSRTWLGVVLTAGGGRVGRLTLRGATLRGAWSPRRPAPAAPPAHRCCSRTPRSSSPSALSP